MKILIIILLLTIQVFTLENGLGRTPPMGWMTWQRFRCQTDCTNDPNNCISEKLIKEMTDHIVADGYLSAGYEYIIVDDCWLAKERDTVTNRLLPDATRFPSGIRALADYVHSRGLKFGIYEDYGTLTCGGYPGSLDYLQLDAETFAEWTVDYVKLDGCYSDVNTMDVGYPLMGKYLNGTNRPMVYSCSWPAYQPNPNYALIAEYCNLWRNYDDIDDQWDSVKSITDWYVKNQDELASVHGPGHFNDPDMLIIGNFGLSEGQSRTQMALWSILAAPLIMSVDLRSIEPWARDILLNKNLIGINQDPLGVMGKMFLTKNNVQMWSKPLIDDKTVFVFMYALPYGTQAFTNVSLNELGLVRYKSYVFYEAFNGQSIGTFKYNAYFNATINPSGSCFAFWVEPVKVGHDEEMDDQQKIEKMEWIKLKHAVKRPLN